MKLVSVILTTYNSASSLERVITSIRNQDGIGELFDIELLVVDDCSSDDTTSILDSMGVTWYSTGRNSGGPNRGRNMGLERATGDYICIVDHDDVWKPHRIVSALPLLSLAPIVSSGYVQIDQDSGASEDRVNRSSSSYIFYEKDRTFRQKLSRSLKGQNTYLGGLIYSSELKHILFEEHFGMVDFDWQVRLFEGQSSVEVCDALYERYISGFNLSLNSSYRLKDYYYSLLFLESYQDKYPELVATAITKIQGSRARYHYLIGDMRKARQFFWRSEWSIKNLAYLLTTYCGATWVKRNFRVFG